jgi:hypothetical protein
MMKEEVDWDDVYFRNYTSKAFWDYHWIRMAFEMLEPCDGKLSRTVLRREGIRKAPALSGILAATQKFQMQTLSNGFFLA